MLSVREYRWLWVADLQSLFGDQLARVALSVLVYSGTGSGLLTAGVYALTYLPAVIGSLLFGWLADRLPRRGLLVGGDLLRAALLALMGVPAVPLWAVAVLLVLVVVVGAPWKAAESALVADILSGEGYVLGVGLRVATVQAAQLVGFAVGGSAVGLLGARTALGIDAATFAASALLLHLGLNDRPAVSRANGDSGARATVHGVRLVFGNPRLRVLLGLSWLAGLFVVPEGLAVPYAEAIGEHAAGVGLILAANPGGLLIGSVVFTRWVPAGTRSRLVAPLAVASGLPLVACWSVPRLAIVLSLLALSGAASAYQVQVMTEFVMCTPVSDRGQSIGVASAGLLAAQGAGLLAGGAAAQAVGVGPAIALAGALGGFLALLLGVHRAHQTSGPTGGADKLPDGI
ncbi:MAG: MFS transporter [Actinomycetota bacterium]|nr:MFS transporter [Actinomycetota bacterium]